MNIHVTTDQNRPVGTNPKNGHATACPYQQVVNHSGLDKRFGAITLGLIGFAYVSLVVTM